MKRTTLKEYPAAVKALLLLRLVAMLLSLYLVADAIFANSYTEAERIETTLRAIFSLLFGMSLGDWQDRWEKRHEGRASMK